MASQSTPLPLLSPTAFFKRLLVGVVLINLVVAAMAASWLTHIREQDVAGANIQTQNLAKVLEQYIVGTIRNIDLALLTAVDEFARHKGQVDAHALDQLLKQQLAHQPELESLRMADAQGIVRYGAGVVASSTVNIADRDFFIAARDGSGMAISQPLFARISQKWVIAFARRVNHADGSFAGVVYVNLALEQLTKTFASLNVGPRGVVTLRGSDLGVIARYPEPGNPGSTIGNKAVSPEFRVMMEAGISIGTFRVSSGLDHIDRVFSFRRVGDYPFFVIVGFAIDDVLADWRSEVAAVAALLTIFLLVTLLAARLLLRTWKSQVEVANALLQQETKFHTLADYTYDWEYWQSADRREILYMTPSCERITGYRAEEFVANPELLVDILHPEDRAAMSTHMDLYVGHSEEAIDFRIRRRDGEIRWIAHACRPVYEPDGRFLGRRISNRDITDRKLIAEALARSEQSLRTAQRIAELGSWELEHGSNSLTCSDEVFLILEIDPLPPDVAYAAFVNTIHPEDKERVKIAFTNAIKNRLPYDITHRLLLADGSTKYVREQCETVYAADGTPLRSIGTLQDVTLTVLSEQSMQESEERFRTIADYTYDWEYWQGPQGEFLYIAPSCQRVTGYSQAEFISKPNLVYDIIHPEDRHLMDEHLGDIRHEDEGSLDYRIIRKDGGLRWIAHGCRAVYAKDGRFLGRRASNRDITDRKSAEEQVQQLAYFDTLTGLPNRRMLFDRLAQALSQAKRFHRSLAIMFLDLDNFKKVNDTLGHDAGDDLLKEVAVRLATCVRSGDTVARQGGDEFIIVLAEIAAPDDASLVAEKILKTLNEPIRLAEQTLQVTTSIGIAVYPVNGDDDLQELMKKADKAMYAVKAEGRNGYRFFIPEPAATLLD